MRDKDPHADLKPVLRTALSVAEDDRERAIILSRISSELQLDVAKGPSDRDNRGILQEIEETLQLCLRLEPDEPYHWIQLAEHLHYYSVDLERALDAINIAIDKASKARSFVRQAHGARIRIAVGIRRFDLVEDSLRNLIEYQPPRDSPDVALESDFVKSIPSGAVSEKLINSYKGLLR